MTEKYKLKISYVNFLKPKNFRFWNIYICIIGSYEDGTQVGKNKDVMLHVLDIQFEDNFT